MPSAHGVDEVERGADAHQVAGPVGGQAGRRRGERRAERLGALADGEPADRESLERQRGQLCGRARAQLEVDPALHDPEERLVAARARVEARLRPSRRPVDRRLDLVAGGRQAAALVERHRDVGAERLLDADRLPRARGAPGSPSRWLLTVTPVVVDRDERAEREHLEAARIGEQRAAPTP